MYKTFFAFYSYKDTTEKRKNQVRKTFFHVSNQTFIRRSGKTQSAPAEA